jgi:hypothetical protein
MANHKLYTRYLEEMGYSENEVLNILNPSEMNSRTAIGVGGVIGLMAGLVRSEKSAETDKNYAVSILKSLTANTNWLLKEVIDGRLKKRFNETGIDYYSAAFPGVFPTNDFNARAVSKYPGLVLLDTACFELIEAFTWIGMWDASYEERAIQIGEIARTLFQERKLPAKTALEHYSLAPNYPGVTGRKVWINDIVTAAEEFILAHEYAHLTLHVDRVSVLSAADRTAQEYEADAWAIDALLRPNTLWGADAKEVILGYETQLAGVCAALGIAHFMEVLTPLPAGSSYPTAQRRMRSVLDQVKLAKVDQYLGLGLPLLDLASAVAIYLTLGRAGFAKPTSANDIARIRNLFISPFS